MLTIKDQYNHCFFFNPRDIAHRFDQTYVPLYDLLMDKIQNQNESVMKKTPIKANLG